MPIAPDNLPDDPAALSRIIAGMAQDALTAEAEIGEKKMAVWATAEADEALAAARTLVHGVRHSVSSDAFGRVRADLDQAGAGKSSTVAALFAGR